MWSRPIIAQLWQDISQLIFRAKESNLIQTNKLTSFLWEYKYISKIWNTEHSLCSSCVERTYCIYVNRTCYHAMHVICRVCTTTTQRVCVVVGVVEYNLV